VWIAIAILASLSIIVLTIVLGLLFARHPRLQEPIVLGNIIRVICLVGGIAIAVAELSRILSQ
jgi:hypothetical protein